METIEPEHFDRNIEQMRAAAAVLRRINSPRWGEMLDNIAFAAEAAHGRPGSIAEQWTWTPVVVHAARLADSILSAVEADPLAAPVISRPDAHVPDGAVCSGACTTGECDTGCRLIEASRGATVHHLARKD